MDTPEEDFSNLHAFPSNPFHDAAISNGSSRVLKKPDYPPNGAPSTSPLSRIPGDIAFHRSHIFALDQPVKFDVQAWERFWPYIDNVWCPHYRPDVTAHLRPMEKAQKFWGICRLNRNWKQPERDPTVDPGRRRHRRTPGSCPAKFRVTMDTAGNRILERSTAEGHNHDLEHVDALKRCSGVRSLVTDPIFQGWESGAILAYLKDAANAPPEKPGFLDEAGGKYLDRKEIVNVFSQQMRNAHPGLDVQQIRVQRAKYEGLKTCHAKGCNKSFADAKELARHKRQVHEIQKHDHSEKLYTCPCRQCHRRKRSKGFPSLVALREHMLRMQHWGMAVFHGPDEPTMVAAVTEQERQAVERGDYVDPGTEEGARPRPPPPRGTNALAVDPVRMRAQSLRSEDGPLAAVDARLGAVGGLGGEQTLPGAGEQGLGQREAMAQRLEALERQRAQMEDEMARLRDALLS